MLHAAAHPLDHEKPSARSVPSLAATVALAAALLGWLFLRAPDGGPSSPIWRAARGASAATPVRRESADTISFPARVSTDGFHRRLLGMPGYHLIVSSAGNASAAALFTTAATDVEILDALEALGARPGDGLGMATWDERRDTRSSAPDRIIAGPAVAISVRVPGRPPLALEDILVDPAGRGFDMRLGGHRANIPHWHSGCVVCLYSCPGSKIGNARYTVRDYMREATAFRARAGVLPRDGEEVTIVMRLTGEPPAAR